MKSRREAQRIKGRDANRRERESERARDWREKADSII